jgi:uncharacterized protein YbjT (DUF2867 family)
MPRQNAQFAGGRRPAGGRAIIICAMRILVTGASGFVGAALIPRLQGAGHELRAFGRDPARVRAAVPAAADLEVLAGDAISGTGLRRALAGVDVAYYLIHSLERDAIATQAFERVERQAADNFAAEAALAGVRRIVYLGGLVPHWGGARASRHLRSREAVERILLAAVPDSVALRASIVIGARSRSFRLLVRLVERMPVLTMPAWQRFRTQPIDGRDITAMLARAADAPLGGRTLEVGGPDVLTYGEMLKSIAELMLVRRPAISLGVTLTPITARVAAAVAGEDAGLVLPLMEGLQGDLLPADDRAAELLGVRLHSYRAAVENALREWEQEEPLAAR